MTKALSTELSGTNIAAALALLESAPPRLAMWRTSLPAGAEVARPGEGERSGIEVLAHMLNAESRSTDAITLALLANEPEVLPIHAERDFGRLFRLDQLGLDELVAYHATRRAILLGALRSLSAARWSRAIRETGKSRRESVYLLTRSLALHEEVHLRQLERRIPVR